MIEEFKGVSDAQHFQQDVVRFYNQNNELVDVCVADFASSHVKWTANRLMQQYIGLLTEREIDTGLIGAVALENALKFPTIRRMHGIQLITNLSRVLVTECLKLQPPFPSNNLNQKEKEKWIVEQPNLLTASLTALRIERQGNDAICNYTSVGDTSTVLHSGGRILQDITGSLEARCYEGEVIAGQEVPMDRIKSDLKQQAREFNETHHRYNVHDQFYYHLIYNAKIEEKYFEGSPEERELFVASLFEHLKNYAQQIHQIAEEVFCEMWKIGFTTYQKLYLQNKSHSHLAHGVLDVAGNTPINLIQTGSFLLKDIESEPHPFFVLHTDGFQNKSDTNIDIDTLKEGGEFAERTAIKVIVC